MAKTKSTKSSQVGTETQTATTIPAGPTTPTKQTTISKSKQKSPKHLTRNLAQFKVDEKSLKLLKNKPTITLKLSKFTAFSKSPDAESLVLCMSFLVDNVPNVFTVDDVEYTLRDITVKDNPFNCPLSEVKVINRGFYRSLSKENKSKDPRTILIPAGDCFGIAVWLVQFMKKVASQNNMDFLIENEDAMVAYYQNREPMIIAHESSMNKLVVCKAYPYVYLATKFASFQDFKKTGKDDTSQWSFDIDELDNCVSFLKSIGLPFVIYRNMLTTENYVPTEDDLLAALDYDEDEKLDLYTTSPQFSFHHNFGDSL